MRDTKLWTLFDVLNHSEGFAGRPASHGHVVLSGGASRKRVNRGGVAKHFVLWNCRGRCMSVWLIVNTTQKSIEYRWQILINVHCLCFRTHKIQFQCSAFEMLTKSCGGAVSDHETRIQASFVDQERREFTERWIAKAFDAPLADRC